MRHYTFLPFLFLCLLLGSFGCSKMETAQTNAAPTTTSDQVSFFGDWTTGQFTRTVKHPSDSTKGIASTSQMVFPIWRFNQDGTVTVGNGASSGSMAFTSLPGNRLVLSLRNSTDTFNVQKTSENGVLLTGARNVNGTATIETLELHRTSN